MLTQRVTELGNVVSPISSARRLCVLVYPQWTLAGVLRARRQTTSTC